MTSLMTEERHSLSSGFVGNLSFGHSNCIWVAFYPQMNFRFHTQIMFLLLSKV